MKNGSYRVALAMALFISASLTIGCNKSQTETATATTEQASAEDRFDNGENPEVVDAKTEQGQSPAVLNTEDLAAIEAAPGEVISQFLAALKSGDSIKAESLLSDTARFETRRANLSVRPPGAENANYSVGTTKYTTNEQNVAHVESIWNVTDDNGLSEGFSITWVLRRGFDEQWKVAGMLTAPATGQPEIFLDFESPKEMLARAAAASTDVQEFDGNIQTVSFEEEVKE